MSVEILTSDIDRLYDAVNSMHKSLQCTICLESMTEPVKTRCGHSFCKLCIAEVLKKKHSSCPLCKKKLDRRNISKDDHLQLCIEKFTALISAIETDSHIDILSYLKQPRDTKESCSNSDVSHSNKNFSRRVSSRKAQSTHQSPDRQIDKPSTSRETINCDNQQYNSSLLDEKPITISNAFSKAGFTDERNANIPEVKVRTWLYTLPDELNTDVVYLNEDDKGKTTLIDQSEDDSKSDATSNTHKKMSKSRKKQSSEYIDEDVKNASQTKKSSSQPKKDSRARQSGKVKTINSRATGKLKYVGIHAKVRAKESQKKNGKKPGFEETNDQQNSISMITTATIEERDRPSLDAASTSSANWSGVLEFGKEIRAKKKRIKKLNVSTEKNKKLPQIMENIKLTPNSEYDLSKIVPSCNTSGDQANNVSNLLEESNDRKQDAADKSPNLSNAKAPLKASRETDAYNKDVSFIKDTSSTNLPMETSSIMLEEGKRVRIMHLNNDQVNQIIGIDNSKPDSQHAENRYREENAESNVCPDLSLSPRKRLTILTPEKLNESTEERERISNAAQVSIKNSKNLSDLTIEDRIAELRESSVKRASEVPSKSPLSGRLSLKRKPGVCSNQNTNSPPLSNQSLADRLSFDRYKNDMGDCRNVDSKDKTQSARMAAVRRHLNLDVDNIVIGSTAPRSIKNQGHKFSVKFMQLGPLIKRSNVRCFYLGATKRERTLKAKVEVDTVYNMQQSISRQEMEWQVAKTHDLVASPNPSNDSQSSSNITVIENLHSADNLNANLAAVPEDAKFSSVATTCRVPATSTPRMDIDRDLSPKRIAAAERISMKASKRSTGSICDAEEGSSRSLLETLRADSSAIRKKTPHAYLSSTSSVKLLSPDKDSQLKFLAIDSPTSKSEDSKASSIRQQAAIKESNFAASTSTARRSFPESSSKKRKRTRYASDEGLFDDSHSDDSNISIDDHTKLNECSRSLHDAKSDLDANKKRRLRSSDDQDVQVISSDSEGQDVSRKTIRKIMSIPNSDNTFQVTWESKLPENVAGNSKSHKTDQSNQQNALGNTSHKKCLLEQNSDDILRNVIDEWEHIETLKTKEDKNLLDRNESMRCPSVGKPASHQSSCSTNALENEERKNTRSSEKSFAAKESDAFESNSIFHSDNVDLMLQQMMGLNSSKTSGKITNPSNDDIINRVLQIDQPRDNPDARRSPSSAARNDKMSQSKKNSGDYLLEDNFDETIANIDLPQSEDVISCSEQPARSHTRTLAEQNKPNCHTMTDEPRGATQETPMTPVSSTNDIFEHSSRNVRKLSTRNASENFDKENTISHVKKRDSMGDRGNKKNVTAKHFVDTIDKDFHREIAVKRNASHEKERSFNRAESFQIDKGHNVSTNSVGQLDDDFENDTFMNVTQDQARLRILEEDLFSSPSTRKNTPKVISRDDPERREEQCTPKRRKLNERDKNATTEERYAEEDDVVENTPERKRKSNESDIKIESRKSTSYPSPITPRSGEQAPSTLFWKRSISKSGNSTFQMIPLDESTPKVARLAASKQSKENETILSGSILLQTDGKTSESIRQLADRHRLCFVCTSLSKVQVSFVVELAAKYNAKYVNQFDRDVTHVIVNTTGEQNVARSTLKYLQGIAHRKWIVSYRWIEDCLREEKLLDEVPYEATTYNDGVIGIQGPRNSRLREKDLFEGFTFLCVKPYHDVSHSQYQDLLLATGATVVDSLEELAKKEGMKGVVIQDNTHDIETIEYWYHTTKAAPITVDWIVECIGHYKLLKLASQYLSLDDFQAIGYPSELVEEYEEYSDDEN